MILQEELGLEPSRELRELEAAILRQDEEPRRALTRGAERRCGGRGARRTLLGGQRWLLAAVAAIGGSVAAALLTGRDGLAHACRLQRRRRRRPRSGPILSEVIPSVPPGRLATDGHTIWATNEADDTVSGIDMSNAPSCTRSPSAAVRAGSRSAEAPSGSRTRSATRSHASTRPPSASSRRSPSDRGPPRRIRGRMVWVTTAGDRSVWGIDPVRGHVRAKIASEETAGESPSAAARSG